MKLSTKSRYGTRLVVDIALHQHNGPVRIQDTVDRQHISLKYLERIAQLLKGAGIISSKRGKKGGHVLAKAPADITVGQIIRSLEDDPVLVSCVSSETACGNAPVCPTRRVWKDASEALFRHLDSVTLEELLRCSRRDEEAPAEAETTDGACAQCVSLVAGQALDLPKPRGAVCREPGCKPMTGRALRARGLRRAAVRKAGTAAVPS